MIPESVRKWDDHRAEKGRERENEGKWPNARGYICSRTILLHARDVLT